MLYVDYIVSRGVVARRISARGYGETQLKKQMFRWCKIFRSKAPS